MVDVQRGASKIAYLPNQGSTHARCQSESDSAISSDESLETDRHPLSGTNTNKHQLGKRPRRLLSPKTVNVLENIALIIALSVVVGLFSLPVVFYFKYAKPHQVSVRL